MIGRPFWINKVNEAWKVRYLILMQKAFNNVI